ncbi:peptidase S10 [Candidatus Bipolaricaulota bacterium]|nr:peptidase S10 [Candidatus Bipolaricaulota bacterium]
MGDETKKPEANSHEGTEKKRKLLGIEPIETQHAISVGDRSLTYTARSGSIALKDEFDETDAEIFFTAYDLDLEAAASRSDRPLTFVFNGGPGSSSIWLHMGALGPKRVRMEKEGWMPSPPFRYEDNRQSWLDRTDLVFIDPVGTGFSRAAKEDLDKKFWSFQGDIESVGEFIRLYLTRYERWTSPLFLAGESYGTTRAAALAGHLVDRGITFNGIVLISTVLDLGSIRFAKANDLPFQLFVPTYAATAWFHGKLDRSLQDQSLPDLMAEVKAWSESELTVALMKGDRLDEGERHDIAGKLSHYTGLDRDYILGTNLRIEIHRFCKALLRADKRSVGRLDSRFKGVEALAINERPEFDPSMQAITPPYTAALNQYVRSELGVETDLVYETLSLSVNEKWQWENGMLPATGEALRGAMAKNPYMRVLVGQGYYDLATPHFATEYMVTHMNVDPELRGNLEMKHYEAGHMFYLDEASLTVFKKDVDKFIANSL